MKSLSLFFTFLLFAIAIQAQTPKKEKARIAVLELSADGITKAEAQTFTNRLRSELVKTGVFIVLERGEMDDILKEQGFQLTGCTSNECAVEAGKLLNVKEMVAGSVGKVGRLYSIDARLIDVETGQILKSVTEDCQCPIERVLTQSIRKIAYKLAGRIITTTTTTVLEEGQGDLFIKSDPNGAEIFLDNVDTGKETPETLQDIQAGEHFIKLVKGKYIGTKTVKVKANDLVTANIELQTATGNIKIYSDPPEATIFVDGEEYGLTPKILRNISIGEHQVRLKLKGYAEYRTNTTVKYNTTTSVNAQLKRLGILSVTSVPSKAKLYILDVYFGDTPARATDMDSGRYVIRLSKEGYVPLEKEITIQYGKTTSLNIRLQKFAHLKVQSAPSEAYVFVNGKQEGQTPFDFKIAPGIVKLTLKKKLYQDWQQTVILHDGENKTINVKMKPEQGGVVFENVQPGALIWLKNEKGQKISVPKNRLRLAAGNYQVFISKAGFLDKTMPLFVTPGKTKTLDASLQAKTRGTAIFRSILFPGLGQLYQDKKGRGFLFGVSFAASVGASYLLTHSYNQKVDQYNDLHNQYEKAVEASKLVSLRHQMNKKYDEINQAEKMRNLFYAAAGGLWLLNVLDAAILPPGWHHSTHISARLSGNTVTAGLTVRW